MARSRSTISTFYNTLDALDGQVEGLLGNANGTPANDLTTADGTVLTAPLSSADLYTTFADSWRVTQSSSLLTYGPGQTTATFTDPSFPSEYVSLSGCLRPSSTTPRAWSLPPESPIPARRKARSRITC